MSNRLQETHSRLSERYSTGDVPWDDTNPPPEVLEFVPSLKPGRVIDLGCGFGRASIYFASMGWEVDGVDFVELALEEARRRSEDAGVSVNYHLGTVTDLSFLEGHYDFALDVGCGHALDEEGLRSYREHLFRLLSPNAYFLLFARCAVDKEFEEDSPAGLVEETLLAVFEEGFTLDWAERSETNMADDDSWPSAWYRFRRN